VAGRYSRIDAPAAQKTYSKIPKDSLKNGCMSRYLCSHPKCRGIKTLCGWCKKGDFDFHEIFFEKNSFPHKIFVC
jgi:hypothetical protein